jgi:hypothetical protein
MQWPSGSRPSQDQTTGPVFILRVVFNHFAVVQDFSDFLYGHSTNDALVNCVFGKLELLGFNLLPYLLDQRHA